MISKKAINFYNEALKIIPQATQTGSKRPVAEYDGVMPLTIESGKGCRFTDIDGKEYIDWGASLGPVILGYAYDEVDDAVRKQLEKGTIFGMPSSIEYELAKEMINVIPGIEMVRFLKTGGDVCSAAVRLARAYTGREKIISIGYHGWHDTFMAAIPQFEGIPKVLRDLVISVPFNDLDAVKEVFEKEKDNIAAVITIPFNFEDNPPEEKYFPEIRGLCDKYGSVLIFDEVLAGFRLALGGAIEYHNIQPDLVVYGKAIANGYPLAAFAGKQEIMSCIDKTLITTTLGGETMSIAASLATLKIMQRDNVHAELYRKGKIFMDGMEKLIKKYSLPGYLKGIPVGFTFTLNDNISEEELQRLISMEREIFEQGVFMDKDRTWLVSHSHTNKDILETLEKIEQAFKIAG